jgi:hypothetical protein
MALKSQRRFISKTKLQSGMLLEFTYKKISDTSTKNYIVLVIDPDRNNHLHALLVEDLSDMELVGMITKLGNFSYDADNPANPLTNLKSDEAYSKYLGIKNQRRYRTFVSDNISNLRQILIGELT